MISGNRLKIIVIDSGLDNNFSYSNNNVTAKRIISSGGYYEVVEDNCDDKVGHGIAILDILERNLENIDILMFKVYDNVLEASEETILFALEYILDNENCNILHFSSGITHIDSFMEFNRLLKKIFDAGTIIVSAFDNTGAVSYPAAFPFVIGVDASENKLDLNEYEFVENSIINVRASSSFHRVRWNEPSNILIQGTSFSSVYITVEVAKLMQNGTKKHTDIMYHLYKRAKNILNGKEYEKYNESFVKHIDKAVIFPFNKEMHAFFRYKDMVRFKITGVYDVKYNLRIGKKVKDVLNLDKESDELIEDINNIDWKLDFDTIILGHCYEINKLTGINWNQYILENAKKHQKRIFSFDQIEIEDGFHDKVYFPKATLPMVPKNRFGKLRNIAKPVLGIFGTSSQQGKFTLQLLLRKKLMNNYKVGQLGTEPQSDLFGINRTFPMGYSSTVYIKGIEAITLLNEYMWDISTMDNDIILVGSQSGTIPYDFNHLSKYPLFQSEFLYGTLPDAVILCINPHDPIEYISRTISFIESIIDTKVIGMVMFPVMQNEVLLSSYYKKRIMMSNEADELMSSINKALKRKVYLLDRWEGEYGIDGLVELIISFFT